MRPLPSCKLDKKVKSVWRISAAIWLASGLFVCDLSLVLLGLFEESIGFLPVVVVTAIFLLLAVICVVVLPNIRFVRWRYEVGEHEVDIMHGIFWCKRTVIPFIRVQNTDTAQGPIMRAFGLSQVTVATAAGEHEIPGLRVEEADALRDTIATQARLAREDI